MSADVWGSDRPTINVDREWLRALLGVVGWSDLVRDDTVAGIVVRLTDKTVTNIRQEPSRYDYTMNVPLCEDCHKPKALHTARLSWDEPAPTLEHGDQ